MIIFPQFGMQTNYDRRFLTGVQSGFGGGVSWQMVLLLVVFLLALAGLAWLIYRYFKPAPYRLEKGDVDLITDPAKIHRILDAAAALRSVMDVEIFDDNYREIYSGPVRSVGKDGRIEVEVETITDINLDFVDRAAQGVFRLLFKGQQAFYQFNAHTLGVGRALMPGRPARMLYLAMPSQLEKGQKRRYIRVEPHGAYAFDVFIMGCQQQGRFLPLSGFKRLHESKVLDVSIGGIQTVTRCKLEDLGFKAGDEVYLHFRLPRQDLELERVAGDFLIRARVLSIQRVVTGRRVMSREADARIVGPNLIRLMFLARGRPVKKMQMLEFVPASNLTFEDLGRWVVAYQRRQLQEERGTERRPDVVKNLYPQVPPEVKAKYPSAPPKRRGPADTTGEED